MSESTEYNGHPSYDLCLVERHLQVKRGGMNDEGRLVIDEARTEMVTQPCGTPLFSDLERSTGVCRSCLSGWSVPLNSPTKAALEMIARALASRA